MLFLLTLLLVSGVCLYYYLTVNFLYWEKRGVRGPRPTPGFGNIKDVILLKKTFGEELQKIYKQYENDPFIGIIEFRKPSVLLRDLKLIKTILVKDFRYFQSRGFTAIEHGDPLSKNIINFTGPRWRFLRTKLTPAFTAAKIRNVFPLIADASDKFGKFLGQFAEGEDAVEFRDLAAKFTTEVVSQCFYGLESDTIQERDNEFRKMCKKVLDPSVKQTSKRLLRSFVPGLYKALMLSTNPPEVRRYFIQIVRDMISHRESKQIVRNDLMQLLMDLRNTAEKQNSGQTENVRNGTTDVKTGKVDDPLVIDELVVAAQAYIFFLAGFETSSTAISFAMYELAANPDVQEKLYTEINDTLAKHGSLNYEAISEMEYLDRVVRETLRKHPPVGVLARLCTETYEIPDSDVVIEKGTKVWIPIYAIHHDPKYYKEPEKFLPDRFLDEDVKSIEKYAYLPFGDGPRNCIGLRFAYFQTKAGLVALLSQHKVTLSPKTAQPLEYTPKASILMSKSGIWLKLHRRNKTTDL